MTKKKIKLNKKDEKKLIIVGIVVILGFFLFSNQIRQNLPDDIKDIIPCGCPTGYEYTTDQSKITQYGFSGTAGCVWEGRLPPLTCVCPSGYVLDSSIMSCVYPCQKDGTCMGVYAVLPCAVPDMPKPFLTCDEVYYALK